MEKDLSLSFSGILQDKVSKYVEESEDESAESYKNEKPCISSLFGGMINLECGASIKVQERTSSTLTQLSMSITPRHSMEMTCAHDEIEGVTRTSMYTLEPHQSQFEKPILVTLPYDSSIPKERLGVFYMEADKDGQPIGTWTHIPDVTFMNSLAIFATSHFSYFSAFEFADVERQRTATVTRTANKWEAVCPGLSYRGLCENSMCSVHNKLVNCQRGFGTFDPVSDRARALIICPVCSEAIQVEKFILYDTEAEISWTKKDGTFGDDKYLVNEDEVKALGIDLNGVTGKVKYKVLRFVTKPRQNSSLRVDVCFAMDCTGSMAKYIQAGKGQITAMVRGIKEELQKIKLNGKLRVSFVGYRDYESKKFKKYEPEKLMKIVPFTENVDAMTDVMAEQKAEGGADGPEHVVGALQQGADMEWNGALRVFVLIGDAPCHGSQYHNLKDSFPDGDPSKLKPETYLKKMVNKNVNFFFVKINSSTDLMITKFRETYDKNAKSLKIEVLDLGTNENRLGTLLQASIMRKINDVLV